jgi:ABC-type lipoprotein export system ATPase subunit
MTAPHPAIHFDNVCQIFGKSDGTSVTALDGLTFDIEHKEFVAVLAQTQIWEGFERR